MIFEPKTVRPLLERLRPLALDINRNPGFGNRVRINSLSDILPFPFANPVKSFICYSRPVIFGENIFAEGTAFGSLRRARVERTDFGGTPMNFLA